MYKIIFILTLTGKLIIGCATTSIQERFTFSEVAQPPTLLEKVEPDYPQKARKAGLEGSVEMLLFVSDKGEVKKTEVINSSGYKILDNAAIKYSQKLKFAPAKKENKPVSIWLSWVLNYQLESAQIHFNPDEYVRTVTDLLKHAEQVRGKERDRVLQKLINSHENYVQRLTKKPELNYNMYVKQIVQEEVFKQWQDFWQDWPLSFVVFHDFVSRFSGSVKITYATDRLLKLIKRDIIRVRNTTKSKKIDQQKKDKFLKVIYSFLNEHYPHAITDGLKAEADKYLKNN